MGSDPRRRGTPGRLDVAGAALAGRVAPGRGPRVVWLGGFHSEMAAADRASDISRTFLRFDDSGHGRSDGGFVEGTISRWRGDLLAVLAPGLSGGAGPARSHHSPGP